jgi:protein gp37
MRRRDVTKIEWVRSHDGSEGMSWNALRAIRIDEDGKRRSANHCEHVNEACRFCYAEKLNARLGGLPFKPGHRKDYTFEIDEKKLLEPLRRKKPTRIFCESMSDMFGEWWPEEFIDQEYAVMGMAHWHTFINLSKRPKRRRDYLNSPTKRNDIELAAERIRASKGLAVSPKWCFQWPLPNVIEGTSVSCQEEADAFVPILLDTPAALRVVSAEPLLGPIDFRHNWQPEGICIDWLKGCNGTEPPIPRIDWLIVGGESGPSARPMHPAWARAIREQCKAAGVAFFFKQWGEFAPSTFTRRLGQQIAMTEHGKVERRPEIIAPSETVMERLGKKAAGRLLDGVEYNEFPR